MFYISLLILSVTVLILVIDLIFLRLTIRRQSADIKMLYKLYDVDDGRGEDYWRD